MKRVMGLIQRFIQDRAWTDVTPAQYAASISIESAELLELFQWGRSPKKEEVAGEIADIFWYLVNLTDKLDISLEAVVKAKLIHNRKKYPLGSDYLVQKRMYRS